MNIDIADIVLFLIIIFYFFLDKYLIPNKINKNLAETESRLSKELADIKSSLSKEQFIHRLQFEKEFKIYEELWKRLLDLRGSTARLIPIIDWADPNKTEDETKKERLEKFTSDLDEVRKAIFENKPFYNEEVYENSNKIIRKSISQITKFHYPEKDIGDHYMNAEKRVNEINRIIDSVEKAIRERIRNIGKAKLIG